MAHGVLKLVVSKQELIDVGDGFIVDTFPVFCGKRKFAAQLVESIVKPVLMQSKFLDRRVKLKLDDLVRVHRQIPVARAC